MKKTYVFLFFTLVLGINAHLQAQDIEAFMGEIKIFAGDVAPKNWAFCNGQILDIENNKGIFSIIGTRFGGNGINNFALPDLRGRMAVGAGRTINEAISFGVGEMRGGAPQELPLEKGTGVEQPITTQPFVAVRYIICINGVFPKQD